jgi:hypothetical protein
MRASIQAITLVVLGGLAARAAQDAPRQIWDSGFKQKRPAAAPSKAAPPAPPASEYRVATKGAPDESRDAHQVIGVTVWRLRPPATSEGSAPRLLLQEPRAQAQPLVAERMRADQRLHAGDLVRIGLEVPQNGYLYVIDRERYADNTAGTPYLIFPATRLSGGDNRVQPGRLVEIPAQTDPLPALHVTPSGPKHTGEELLILVSPEPVDALYAESRERSLDAALVQKLEQDLGRPAERLDLVRPELSALWTTSEQQAGTSKRLLTQDDPLPESLYRTRVGANGAMLFRVLLAVQ